MHMKKIKIKKMNPYISLNIKYFMFILLKVILLEKKYVMIKYNMYIFNLISMNDFKTIFYY